MTILEQPYLYPRNREVAFQDACKALGDSLAFKSDSAAIAQGDSLDLLALLPDHSIDLILTDPPYHSTKKSNIYGDSSFANDEAFRSWVAKYTKEFARVLRPNGSLYMFCSSDMAPFLYCDMAERLNMHALITWSKPNAPGYDGWKQKMKKTSLRRWYPHTERIIFASPAAEGNLKRSPFGNFLRGCRKQAGFSANYLTELVGAYGKVNNGGAVSNWETGRNIPSREQYTKISAAFLTSSEISSMPAYEDVIRAFTIDPDQPFIDVWDFENVRPYRGKHPAEKPRDMLKHIIRTSSYGGGVVLDCFSGSGSTLIGAMELGRRTIGMEIEEKWVDYSIGQLKAHGCPHDVEISRPAPSVSESRSSLPLFAVS